MAALPCSVSGVFRPPTPAAASNLEVLYGTQTVPGGSSSIGYQPQEPSHRLRRLALAATAAAAADVASRRRHNPQPSQTSRGRRPSSRPYRQESRGPRSNRSVREFASIKVTGELAAWLDRQEKASGKEFRPSPIQQAAIQPIYQGESIAICSATGSGKSLAFLLPTLQRLQELWSRRTDGSDFQNLQMLVLLPSADLQVQMCGLIRSLVGEKKADSVRYLRRDVDNSVPTGTILVATPQHLIDLLEDDLTNKKWREAMESVRLVVVDEADRFFSADRSGQRRFLDVDDLDEGECEIDGACAQLLRAIAVFKQKDMRKLSRGSMPWQLVASSATLNRLTTRGIMFSAGVKVRRITVKTTDGFTPVPTVGAGKRRRPGSESVWPAGLKHSLEVLDDEFSRSQVMHRVRDIVLDQGFKRTLVVISAKGKIDRSTYGQFIVLGQLRRLLEKHGISVMTCSQAVEAACLAWDEGELQQLSQSLGYSHQEVLVADIDVIRGIDLENIDCVILIGDPGSIDNYIHCAGRTCRLSVGMSVEQTSGHMVSIVPAEAASRRLKKFAHLAGFSFTPLELNKSPSIAASVKMSQRLDLDDEIVQAALSEGLPPEEAYQMFKEYQDEDASDVAANSNEDDGDWSDDQYEEEWTNSDERWDDNESWRENDDRGWTEDDGDWSNDTYDQQWSNSNDRWDDSGSWRENDDRGWTEDTSDAAPGERKSTRRGRNLNKYSLKPKTDADADAAAARGAWG